LESEIDNSVCVFLYKEFLHTKGQGCLGLKTMKLHTRVRA
jgi:hypothetical protein